MITSTLKTEFLDLQPRLVRLQRVMRDQLEHMVEASGLTLGVPIESRIKSWESIDSKLKRKLLTPRKLSELDDLLGVRAIFLFQRDLDDFISNVEKTFAVHSREDTSARLGASQFGYKSQHYVVSAPEHWATVPNMSGLTDLKVELQMRTLPQHIWAAASHKLQYKIENAVPEPIRRSIHRVSALLELVDLELGRVLQEKDEYVEAQHHDPSGSDALDVSVIEAVLDAELPAANRDRAQEDYSNLLRDLSNFSIGTRKQLQDLLRKHRTAVLEYEHTHADYAFGVEDDLDEGESMSARAARGVYFTHVGLARQALSIEFGEDQVRGWLGKWRG